MGFCGCYSDTLFELTLNIFKKLYESHDTKEAYYYDYEGKSRDYTDLQELILHCFDMKNLTEHGLAVRGCWLTDKGFDIAKKVFNS